MGDEAKKTGSIDRDYDLINVVYHALQGAETIGMYIEDARQVSDPDLEEYFRKVQARYRDMAKEGERFIGRRFGGIT